MRCMGRSFHSRIGLDYLRKEYLRGRTELALKASVIAHSSDGAASAHFSVSVGNSEKCQFLPSLAGSLPPYRASKTIIADVGEPRARSCARAPGQVGSDALRLPGSEGLAQDARVVLDGELADAGLAHFPPLPIVDDTPQVGVA